MNEKPQKTHNGFSYTASHRVFEIAAICTVCSLEVWTFSRFDLLLQGIGPAGLIGACLLGYLMADFVSGLVHWACDRYGSPHTPYLGPNFIATFRDHHADPKGITRHDFIETNGANCIACLPVLLPVAIFTPLESIGPISLFLFTALHALCLWVFATNQFHKWAHETRPHVLARTLQRLGIAIRPEHHRRHHHHPFDTHYCITSGLLNRCLEAIGFWERMERFVKKMTGFPAGINTDAHRSIEASTGGG